MGRKKVEEWKRRKGSVVDRVRSELGREAGEEGKDKDDL